MKKEIAVVLIKPDAIRDHIEKNILDEIQVRANVRIIFCKEWSVRKEQVGLIYPDTLSKPFFPSLTKNLTAGPSIFCIVEGEPGIYERLRLAKGKINEGGLRKKYCFHSIDEWKMMGYDGTDLLDKIVENRLHTTDGMDETIFLCSLALEKSEARQIGLNKPSLPTTTEKTKTAQ